MMATKCMNTDGRCNVMNFCFVWNLKVKTDKKNELKVFDLCGLYMAFDLVVPYPQ